MKKGCFISVIAVLIILLLGVFYLFKFHGSELLEVGKDKVVELSEYKIYSELDNLENKQFTDSLKIVIKKYFRDIDTLEIRNQVEKIKELTDNIDVITKDSKIDSFEYKFILRTLSNYERR